MNRDKCGKFISLLRKEKNMTQEQLAEKMGVSINAVSKWERGLNFPDVSLFKNLCNELGITIEELINGEYSKSEEAAENAIISIVKSNNTEKKKLKLSIIISIIVILILMFIMVVIYINNTLKYPKELGDDKLNNLSKAILSINKGDKTCVPTSLAFYEDGTYELFTSYLACKPNQVCNMMLVYSKSIKGTYDYDLEKILVESTNANNLSFDMDNLPEYEIYLGDNLVNKYDTLSFVVEKCKNNKYLDELLRNLKVDLSKCAKPEY